MVSSRYETKRQIKENKAVYLVDCNNENINDAFHNCKQCPIKEGIFVIPIVVSLLEDGGIYIYSKRDDLYRQCLLMSQTCPLQEGGAFYFYFNTTEDKKNTIPSLDLKSSNIVVGLMLQHCTEKCLYYVTTWDWKEVLVDKNGEIVFDYPRFDKCSY